MQEPSDEDMLAVAAFLAGLAAGALKEAERQGILTAPVTVEHAESGSGTIRLRLASGMLATITVSMSRDMRGGWYHQGHFHAADDEPHDHSLRNMHWSV
jgi:hypothetical protein